MARIQRRQHLRRLDDAVNAERRQRQEPGQHHRPVKRADALGAARWEMKTSRMTSTVTATIQWSSSGAITSSPSIADSTEIAG